MAFKEKEIKTLCVLLFLATVISQMSYVTATNYDCKGKAFYCLNSTHFMICLDLGDGISTTVEDFVIPCPPPTICIESNEFECEYHTTTTLKPIVQSEQPATELNVQMWRDDSDDTTFLPFWFNREDSVKSEKYYNILDDQPNLMVSEYTQIPEITDTHIKHQSITETINELNRETTTLSHEENNSLTPTISIAEEITISTNIAYDDEIVASSQLLEEDSRNALSEGYDQYFDTVSTTILSESTTQITTQYNDIQSSTYNLDEYNPRIEEPFTSPVLNFYTYQEEATKPQEITLTTDFASDMLITTLQEREEIEETTNNEIRYPVTTETEKYLNTNLDYVYTITSIASIQEAEEMLNEVTNTEMNYGKTTEINDYMNSNKFVKTNPLITFQEESEIIKDVVINNTSDAITSAVFLNNNSLTTLPEDETQINYRKTEDTEINYVNIVETNYPITTETHEYINTLSVSRTEKYTTNEDYKTNFPKSTTTIGESSTIDIKYITRPYVSQILNNDISQIKNMDAESTYYPSNLSPNANVNIISKNTQDVTTNNDKLYLDFRMNEMPFQSDENLSEILQTTSKVPVTDYMMQDTISPFDYPEPIHNVEQKSHSSTENITELGEYVSSTTIDKLTEKNVELTVQVDYQIATDSSLLSPIEVENTLHTNILGNIPRYLAFDNVTKIKTNDTVILAENNEHHIKRSNSKNQDKTIANVYTTSTQSYYPTNFSPASDNDSVMKKISPDLKNPKEISTAFENYFKTMDMYLPKTTTSEQKNNDAHAFSIEDNMLTTVFTTSFLLKDTDFNDLYNTENNNQYEVTKEKKDKSPAIVSTTPSLYDLNKLKGVIIDNNNNLAKSKTESSTVINSPLSISHDRSSLNYTVTLNNEILTNSYANNNAVNSFDVIAIENDVTGNLQDNETTNSSINIQNIKQALEELGPVGYMDVTKITDESKPINTTNYEDKHSSVVGNSYPTVENTPRKIPSSTTIKLPRLSTTMPPVPTIAIINGTKTVVIYSGHSKSEATGDAIKLAYTVINNTNSKKNTSIVESHGEKIVKDLPQNSKVSTMSNASYTHLDKYEEIKSPSIALAYNITLDKHETIRKKENITPNFEDASNYLQQKKESVSIQTSEPCNKTMPDTTNIRNQSNTTSHPITTEQLNFTCINRYRGKYSDQNNCQTFYMCIGTISPIVGQCPQNSVFSDILNQCTRNLSHCIRNNQFQCVSPGRFCDLWVRDTYYICLRQNSKFLRFKLRCQKGYILNRTSITCVQNPVENPFFLESYSTSSSSSSSADSKSEQIYSKNKDMEFKCEKEGVFPDPSHCRKYYVCKKVSKTEILLKKKKCDSDEVFNKKKKKCVDEDSYECKT